MAFPIVQTTAETAVSTAATSHPINLPSGIQSGDLIVITCNKGTPAALTWVFNTLAGWSELLDEDVANGLTIWYRRADGTEGATATFTSAAAIRSASIAFRISGAEDPATQAPQIGTTATGTSISPNPPTVTPTGGAKDYLWLAFFGQAGEEADDDTWANTPPTSYLPSPPLQKTCGTVGTNLGGLVAAASRQLNASSEDPGTFNVDVSAAWRAQTIAIHPVPTPPNPVHAGTGTSIQGSSSAMNVPVPSGVAADDIVNVYAFTDTTATITALASGFAEAADSPVAVDPGGGGQAHRLHILWKRATGADSGTYDFTLSGAVYRYAVAARYTGAITSGDPWDVTASNSDVANGTASPAVSDTTTVNDALVVWAATDWSAGAAPSWTPPTGFTERIDTGDAVLTFADNAQASAGATGSISGSNTGSGARTAWLGALKPAGSGTTFTQSASGSITGSAALARTPGKALAATATATATMGRQPAKTLTGSSTSTGTPARRTAKTLTGSSTGTGALATVRAVLISLAGTATATATVVKRTAKLLAGSSTTTGAPTRRTAKTLTGSSTATAALAVIKAILRTFTGTSTGTGALRRTDGKTVAGIATATGALARRPAKTVTGTATGSGVASVTRAFLRSLAGSLTGAGTMARVTGKATAGSLAAAGVVLKLLSKLLGGTSQPTGTVAAVNGNAAPPVPGTFTHASTTATLSGRSHTAGLDVHSTSGLDARSTSGP